MTTDHDAHPPPELPFDSKEFRRVLGHFAAGIAAITTIDDDGPTGMIVVSFTSVSLDPPLVSFCADKASGTWARIAGTGRFCVNVLRAEQKTVSDQLAARGSDKFAGLEWEPGPTGSPVLADVMAWIDCEVADVIEAGDHWIVLGRVIALGAEGEQLPLIFFRGGFGTFEA